MNYRSAVLTTVREPRALVGENFRAIYEFWLSAKGQHELPPITAINPQRIPKALLADCSLMSIEDGPKRFFIRLVGTRVVQELGFDITNSWGDDQPNAPEVITACGQCVQSRLPLYSEISTAWAGNAYKRSKVLMLPYAGLDNSVRRILSYIQFSYHRTKLVL
jgi:hypothetical protein